MRVVPKENFLTEHGLWIKDGAMKRQFFNSTLLTSVNCLIQTAKNEKLTKHFLACFIFQFTLSEEKTLNGGNPSQKSVKYFWCHMKDAHFLREFMADESMIELIIRGECNV
ncbi:hypothetical protein MTBBW1_830048 [Desulfamplus magnetovallimortis]|uniref:Uncharacterized protein n=1 Tax=Desulfamplus magnetovallimortis TaxID=1246637 RepID=A0A1W1HKL4_9BACT|nr:hypothetical protein MTBBW1_830048 [Desulfamplus magnetovallimortis]